jgi:hypothetical protein
MAWIIAYRHLLRSDEAGIKFVPDWTQAVAEGARLEALGNVVTKIAEIPPSGPAAIKLSA